MIRRVYTRALYIQALAAMVTITVSCNGPIRTDPQPPPPPAGVSRENAHLAPRRAPLSVGDPVPSFVMDDQNGLPVGAGELTASSGAVLIFTPPADSPAARPAWDWARRNHRLLQQRGIELLFATPHPPSVNDAVAGQEGLRLALLSDPGSWVARAFGAASDGQPAPSQPWTFVLGSNGRIQFVRRGLPPASDLVVAAESLPGQPRDSIFGDLFR